MNIKKSITIHKRLFPSIIAVLCSILIVVGMTYIAHSASSTTTIGQNISTNNLTVAGTLEVTGNATTTGNQVVSGTSTFAGVNLFGDLDLNLKEIRDVVLENLTTFPSTPVEGQMFWSTATSTPYWYTGSQWKGDVSGATFVVAASDSKNKWQADYIADGTADDVEIQAAINALPTVGGEVHLLEGTYNIASGITISGNNVILSGSGDATHVIGIGSAGSIGTGINVTGDYVTIRDFFFDGNTNVISYQIIIKNNQYSRVENMTICCSRTDGLVFGPDTADGIATNNFLYNHYNPDSVADHTASLEVEDGAQRIMLSHNKVYNSNSGFFLHTHADNNAVKDIVFSNNILLAGPDANDLSSTGIYVSNAGTESLDGLIIANNIIDGGRIETDGVMYILIDGNVFKNSTSTIVGAIRLDGDVSAVVTNNIISGGATYGIHSYASSTVISNNKIYNNNHNGIRLEETADYVTVIGNVIKNNGVTAYAYGIDLQGADYVLIEGNQIFDDISVQENGIRIRSGSTNVLVDGNIITGNTSNQIWDDTTDSIIRNNIGYLTATSSTATITSGNTYVDVSHKLDATPATSTISIVPTNNLGDASSTSYWISKVGSSTFRINVGVDPGASGADFSWQVGSY